MVSFHGVEVFVPAAWKINDMRCGTPMHDTVVVEDGSPMPACMALGPAGLTVVRIAPTTKSHVDALATRPTTVDGEPAMRGSGVPAGGKAVQSVLLLPGPGVVVSVESPDPAAAGRILDSVSIAPVDVFGCVDPVRSLVAPATTRPGAASALVPGKPTSAVVCSYDDYRVSQPAAVPASRLTTLITTLNALPSGVSQPGPGFGEVPAMCAADLRRGFIVRFHYSTGPAVDVYVHISACQNLSASNGVRTTKINAPLVDFLLSTAGYAGGFPNPQTLR